MEEISFTAASFSFDGIELPASVSDISYQDTPRREPMAGAFKGTLTGTMELSPEFLRALDAFSPPPRYRELAGAVWVASPHPVEVCPAGWAKPLRGLLWSDIGETCGPVGTNRLRKFIRRGDRLVEVRSRGRTGLRSLDAAVKAAGIGGLVPRAMTIEGPAPSPDGAGR